MTENAKGPHLVAVDGRLGGAQLPLQCADLVDRLAEAAAQFDVLVGQSATQPRTQ